MSEMQGPQWCTIESDPGVFTELIEKFGVSNVQVEELWNMEDETFERLGEIYGLIFLFKWDSEIQKTVNMNVLDVTPEGLYFAEQKIHNACGTQAIVNILLNCNEIINLGETLTKFREFTISLPSNIRGEQLNNSNEIRNAHNSFRRQEPIQLELAKEEDEKEDAFHFISYVPLNGILYELDGLQKGPRLIGDIKNNKEWFKDAKPAIQQRIQQYETKELRFTLLAICKNLKKTYEEELEELESKTDETSELRKTVLRDLIREETEKFKKWKRENIRRKHNYFPFIFKLLTQLSQKGKLEPVLERAIEKRKEKVKQLKEKRQKEKENKSENNNNTTTDTNTNTNTTTTTTTTTTNNNESKDKDGDVTMPNKEN